MKNQSDKGFKITVIVLLFLCLASTVKQNYDGYKLNEKLAEIEGQVYQTKNSLSSDIDDVRKAVIIWSN